MVLSIFKVENHNYNFLKMRKKEIFKHNNIMKYLNILKKLYNISRIIID